MLNEELVKKVIALIDKGLVQGLGSPEPGKMCVEAVLCAALELPHGDDPGCVMQALRSFKIGLNDSGLWSDQFSRAAGMKRLAIAQIGSLGMDEIIFVKELAKLALKWASESTAAARAARAEAEARATAAAKRVAESAESAERAAAKWAAESAAWAEWAAEAEARWAESAAWAEEPRWAATKAAEEAAVAAAKAARAAEWVATGAGDKVLADCAEDVVQLLILLEAPGTKYLYLTEKTA